jgi:hypothetical protein
VCHRGSERWLRHKCSSINLTPDKTGRAEGGRTLDQFKQIMRVGTDFDHIHPRCTEEQINQIQAGETSVCIPTSPGNTVNGNLLQVMPWPAFAYMTDHQLDAIYEYLRTIAGRPTSRPFIRTRLRTPGQEEIREISSHLCRTAAPALGFTNQRCQPERKRKGAGETCPLLLYAIVRRMVKTSFRRGRISSQTSPLMSPLNHLLSLSGIDAHGCIY